MTVVSFNVSEGMVDCRMMEPVPIKVFLNSMRIALGEHREEEALIVKAPYVEMEECEE